MNVTIYTTPTCIYCRQAKEFFARQGVPFVEKNVAADRQAAREMLQLSGQQGVPVIVLDKQVVIGFDQPRLMKLLKQAQPKLGASVADAASQVGRDPGIPSSGAYVGQVRAGSPAAQAGLRQGDVITSLGGQAVNKAADLHRIVPQMPLGRDVSLIYVRQGQERNTLIRL